MSLLLGGQYGFNSLPLLHQEDLMEGMNSPYSSYRPGAIHPILHIVQVQFVLFFESSWCKTASAAKGLNQFCPPMQQLRHLPSLISVSSYVLYIPAGLTGAAAEMQLDLWGVHHNIHDIGQGVAL